MQGSTLRTRQAEGVHEHPSEGVGKACSGVLDRWQQVIAQLLVW